MAPPSFAIWAYAVKLVNSVAVLLVVNCSSLSDLQTKAMAGVSAQAYEETSLILNATACLWPGPPERPGCVPGPVCNASRAHTHALPGRFADALQQAD